WGVGLDLQLRGRAISVEAAATHSLSGARHVWGDAAGNGQFYGGTAGGAGTGRRSACATPEEYADAGALLCAYRATASLPLRHGGRADAGTEVFCGAGAHDFSGQAVAQALARAAHGRDIPTALDPWRAGESGGDADGKSSGKPELYRVEGNAGFLRYAVRFEDDHLGAGFSRARTYRSPH